MNTSSRGQLDECKHCDTYREAINEGADPDYDPGVEGKEMDKKFGIELELTPESIADQKTLSWMHTLLGKLIPKDDIPPEHRDTVAQILNFCNHDSLDQAEITCGGGNQEAPLESGKTLRFKDIPWIEYRVAVKATA